METIIFSTPSWHWHYDGSFAEAAAKCIELSETTDGRRVSNRGGWQSSPILFDEVPELLVVQDFVNKCLRDVEQSVKLKYNCPLKLDIVEGGAWINVNKKGDVNIPHYHPDCAFAFVCYLQADADDGQLVVHRSDLMEHYPFNSLNSDFYPETAVCKVSTGMGIMFPAWLQHEVLAHTSDTPRISVALNVKQI